ncbi:MAG TPA: polysaccharide deacetylase family protein [Propylenella sp.]
MSRHSLIRVALEGLSFARATRWLPDAPDAAGFAVTLHHVAPLTVSAFAPNALLSVTPDFLDRFLGRFIAAGWRFVTVEELVSDRGAEACGNRRIAVTLDDGFRDNFVHALPVFRRHEVPFTLYVCPGFCDRTAELWWEALERIVARSPSVSLAAEGPAKELPSRNPREKKIAFELWRQWLTTEADEARQRRAIRALAENYRLDLSALACELVMDWDGIRAIAADPLCSIGAHTMTHPALGRLSSQAAFAEMRDSADRIEKEIGRRPATIAFPYGNPLAAGAREARLAEEAGFLASFTTRPGYVPLSGERHGLPRVSLNGLFQQIRYLEVLLTPGLWRLRDRIHAGRQRAEI